MDEAEASGWLSLIGALTALTSMVAVVVLALVHCSEAVVPVMTVGATALTTVTASGRPGGQAQR
ncbi:hypothetical protein [Streptomyces parvulus]|uniref:hypothetical protein n=1 Tax=Streptomyces parvulus TaxID=146923 RepID=UPI001CF94366|nr:hypothetical protein [Streptomyces parvulus]